MTMLATAVESLDAHFQHLEDVFSEVVMEASDLLTTKPDGIDLPVSTPPASNPADTPGTWQRTKKHGFRSPIPGCTLRDGYNVSNHGLDCKGDFDMFDPRSGCRRCATPSTAPAIMASTPGPCGSSGKKPTTADEEGMGNGTNIKTASEPGLESKPVGRRKRWAMRRNAAASVAEGSVLTPGAKSEEAMVEDKLRNVNSKHLRPHGAGRRRPVQT